MRPSYFRRLRGPLVVLLMLALHGTAHAGGAPPWTFPLDAPAVSPAPLRVSVYLPPGYAPHRGRRYPVLYANDGQDMDAVDLSGTLAALYRERTIRPVIVVAVDMPADRADAYGLSDRAMGRSVVGGSRIGPIGSHAQDYSAWFATQLVPWVDAHYRTQATPRGRSLLGWSLGALNAFNLAWEYPELFGRGGAFSPSFWLAGDRTDARRIQHTRLAQAMADRGPPRKGLAFWFAVGGAEESGDRDGEGVIDAVDDLDDLVEGYRDGDGFRTRGLRQLGYTVAIDPAPSARRADVTLVHWQDGQHNQATWKRMLPPFLRRAYGR
ncbi:alpha/beta hydrolase [Frateuria defendens]|uniref:alpha/beta hydrolase n=1 Tax=Frateuria defendens TaxID=2219559 RepID=UPI00066FF7A3|nr:alpha/beta hydrolase-fold protein [Frateuria defendens]